MPAHFAGERVPHEQGRSGITNPSRPGHGGGSRSATTRRSGGLSMSWKTVSHGSMIAIGAVEAGEARPTRAVGRAQPAI